MAATSQLYTYILKPTVESLMRFNETRFCTRFATLTAINASQDERNGLLPQSWHLSECGSEALAKSRNAPWPAARDWFGITIIPR